MQLSRVSDGKKYMWDGVERADEATAAPVLARYQAAGFDTLFVTENERFYLFTRRVVSDIRIDGPPPA